MARLQDTTTLVPIPRTLVDDVVRALLGGIEALPCEDGVIDIDPEFVGDVRLLEGEHLTTGAKYRFTPPAQPAETEKPAEPFELDLELLAWDRARTGAMSVEVGTTLAGHAFTTRVDLQMQRPGGDRLQSISLTGGYQGPGPLRFLQRATWQGEVRLDDWWATFTPKSPPVSVRVRHRWALASFALKRGKDKKGQWTVENTLRLGGRGIARPFAGFGLLLYRRRLRRHFNESTATAAASWNHAVPDMVKRGVRERVTLDTEAALKSISRSWAEQYVAALHRQFEELPIVDGHLGDPSSEIRLVEGEHARPGARYELRDAANEKRDFSVYATLVAWDAAGPNRIEFSSPDGAQSGWAELDSAQKPTLFRAAFTSRAEDDSELKLSAEVDLERWWTSVTGTGVEGRPPIRATAEHALYEAVITASPSKPEDEQWPTKVSVTVEGRGWARPLFAAFALVAADSMRGSLETIVAPMAGSWNTTVSTSPDPAAAAASTLRNLRFTPEDEEQPES